MMVTRHRATTWIIFIGIRVPKLVDLGSKLDIWWKMRIFSFIVLLKSVDNSDGLYDALGSPRSYQKTFNMKQKKFTVSLP